MKKLCSAFKELDRLAPDFSLNYRGGGGVRTHLGSFLWLCCTGVFLSAVGYFSYIFLRTDQPSVEVQSELSDVYPRLDLTTSRRVPIILAYLDDTVILKPSEILKYVTPLMRDQSYTTVQAANGSQTYEYTDEIQHFVGCEDLFSTPYNHSLFPSESSGFMYRTVRDYGLCLNWTSKNYEVFGATMDSDMRYASFALMPCILDSGCADAEELKRFSIILSVGEEVLNYSNYEEPLKFTYNADEYYLIDPSLSNMVTHKLMVNEIWDDKGLFFPQSFRVSYTTIQKSYPQLISRDASQLHCTMATIRDLSCKPYMSQDYISGGGKTVVVRSYVGILDWLSNIGGVREILYFVGFLCYFYYNGQKTKEVMVANVYDVNISRIGSDGNIQTPNKSSTNSTQSASADKQSAGGIRSQKLQQWYGFVERGLDVVGLLKTLQIVQLLEAVLLAPHQRRLLSLATLGRLSAKTENGASTTDGSVQQAVETLKQRTIDKDWGPSPGLQSRTTASDWIQQFQFAVDSHLSDYLSEEIIGLAANEHRDTPVRAAPEQPRASPFTRVDQTKDDSQSNMLEPGKSSQVMPSSNRRSILLKELPSIGEQKHVAA